MTIKIILRGRVKRGGWEGLRKEGRQGTHLEIILSGKSTGKTAFWKIAFLLSTLFPGNAVTIILDNYPPSTLQGVGLGGRKNSRINVGENYCHFGASCFLLSRRSF